ncbi:MAG: ATP-dependent DNA helicase RecG [Bacteroidota bacterium]
MGLQEMPVWQLNKIGQKISAKLKKLGILSALDLIYHFPCRYEDFSQIKNIADLKAGESATVKGKIELLSNKRSFKKRMVITECFVSDSTGSVSAVWFNQTFISKVLKNNDEIYLSGKVSGDLFSCNFQNPSYEKIIQTQDGTGRETTHTARLVPIYRLTEGISEKQIRFLIKQALDNYLNSIADWLPANFLIKHNLAPLKEALKQIHFPENQLSINKAGRRLKFDELLKLHLLNLSAKKQTLSAISKPIAFNESQTRKIVGSLHFALTDSQKKTAWQILQDMSARSPMNRLLQGDVGCGKTVVAALAIANASLSGKQSILLCPTEILASQHFISLINIFKTLKLNVALLTSGKKLVCHTTDKQPSKLSKPKLLKSIASGEINLIIGTHALLQDKIRFSDLALIVIDEQHRFGVEQRMHLKKKILQAAGYTPHLLSMTATPIPRTLALTVYGDLDISVICELPPDRKKPITRLVPKEKRDEAYEFILQKIKEGRQAYVICPVIEESDRFSIKAAEMEYQKLSEEIFPQLKIGLLHGKLKSKEKSETLDRFLQGKIDILVATSVVEVGVNIPNASIMIIESADRFGLAQLHQFRGRVNRSFHQSYCLLFTQCNFNAGSAESTSEKTLTRLNTLVDCYDGFKLTEEDLKQRGFGNLFGTEQSGFFSQLKIANLAETGLVEETKNAALELFENNQKISDKLNSEYIYHPE